MRTPTPPGVGLPNSHTTVPGEGTGDCDAAAGAAGAGSIVRARLRAAVEDPAGEPRDPSLATIPQSDFKPAGNSPDRVPTEARAAVR